MKRSSVFAHLLSIIAFSQAALTPTLFTYMHECKIIQIIVGDYTTVSQDTFMFLSDKREIKNSMTADVNTLLGGIKLIFRNTVPCVKHFLISYMV